MKFNFDVLINFLREKTIEQITISFWFLQFSLMNIITNRKSTINKMLIYYILFSFRFYTFYNLKFGEVANYFIIDLWLKIVYK